MQSSERSENSCREAAFSTSSIPSNEDPDAGKDDGRTLRSCTSWRKEQGARLSHTFFVTQWQPVGSADDRSVRRPEQESLLAHHPDAQGILRRCELGDTGIKKAPRGTLRDPEIRICDFDVRFEGVHRTLANHPDGDRAGRLEQLGL